MRTLSSGVFSVLFQLITITFSCYCQGLCLLFFHLWVFSGDICSSLYANLNKHSSLFVQYNRPRPHIIVVFFIWVDIFHWAPAVSVVEDVWESRYKPAATNFCLRCSCFVTLKLYATLSPWRAPTFFFFFFHRVNIYTLNMPSRLFSLPEFIQPSACSSCWTLGCHWSTGGRGEDTPLTTLMIVSSVAELIVRWAVGRFFFFFWCLPLLTVHSVLRCKFKALMICHETDDVLFFPPNQSLFIFSKSN